MTYLYSAVVYSNLCESRKPLHENYGKGSNLHRHHIIPKHSGGKDVADNYTYLTVKEHIIAHYLLWRIHKNPNDLRSIKLLGANLTYAQRRIVGEYCRDNLIGIFGASEEDRDHWRSLGMQTQQTQNTKDTFYYWSTDEGRKERASLGGKASLLSGNNTKFEYWMSEEGREERASLGGKVHTGKRCMYKPGDKSFKRVPPDRIQEFLDLGYVFGSPIPTKNQFTVSS